MTNPLTEEEIKALAESGYTEGEWKPSPWNDADSVRVGKVVQTGLEFDPIGFKSLFTVNIPVKQGEYCPEQQKANALVCAAAPALIATIKHKDAEIERLRARLYRTEDAIKAWSEAEVRLKSVTEGRESVSEDEQAKRVSGLRWGEIELHACVATMSARQALGGKTDG